LFDNVHSEYDFAGRLEARCTYAGTESRGHRFYTWRRNDRLLSMRSHLRKSPVMYDYDSFGTLVGASLDMSEYLFKAPDIIGNVYRDRDARGRVYDRSGRLLKDEKNYYRYDGEGNLILKSTRNVLEPPVMHNPRIGLTSSSPEPHPMTRNCRLIMAGNRETPLTSGTVMVCSRAYAHPRVPP